MAILPLPQFEADLEAQRDEERREQESRAASRTMVVRFGAMKLIGEYAYDGGVKPGCGSKVVVRSHRGTEIAEVLTSTCPNSGCSKSVSRKEVLRYVENSGGRDYPFFGEGRVLRVATLEDLDQQSRLEQSKHGLKMEARRIAEETGVRVKIVDAEPILGGERLTIFYASEERVDVLPLVRALQDHFRARLDLKHVGSRDEARLTADYEKCGQYCCCKNFLKVLKPVSMKSAKVQKATLDPLKISGRCGRLMCCLRYEDETYEELKKRLPHKRTRVGTSDGDGTVIDGQILTQLVMVRLDIPEPDGTPRDVVVPVEELRPPTSATPPPPAPVVQPPAHAGPRSAPSAPGHRGGDPRRDRGPRPRPESGPAPRPPAPAAPNPAPPARDELDEIMESLDAGDEIGDGGPPASDPGDGHGGHGPPDGGGSGGGSGGGRRRRRRRRGGGPPPAGR